MICSSDAEVAARVRTLKFQPGDISKRLKEISEGELTSEQADPVPKTRRVYKTASARMEMPLAVGGPSPVSNIYYGCFSDVHISPQHNDAAVPLAVSANLHKWGGPLVFSTMLAALRKVVWPWMVYFLFEPAVIGSKSAHRKSRRCSP